MFNYGYDVTKAKINIDASHNANARPNVKLNARMFDKIMWTLLGLASLAYFVGVVIQ